MNHTMEKIDVFKQIMGHYPTGVTIVTTMDENEEPAGLTVNSFTSVSINPLLVLWCIDKKTSSFETFLKANGFAIHTLSSDQVEACWAFAGKGSDRFMGVNWYTSENRLPIIEDSLGTLECRTVQRIDAGDHVILVGEVQELIKKDKEPLLFYNKKAGTIPKDW